MFSPETIKKSINFSVAIQSGIVIILMCILITTQLHFYYEEQDSRLKTIESKVLSSLMPINLSEYTFASVIPIRLNRELLLPSKSEALDGEDLYKKYVHDIFSDYESIAGEAIHEGLTPEVIIAQMYFESRFNPDVVNKGSNAIGLMQIVERWHKDRMVKLHVTDLSDPYSNILVGIDLMNDLLKNYCDGDTGYALMLYNMNWDSARKLHSEGKLNAYAKDVLEMAEKLSKEVE